MGAGIKIDKHTYTHSGSSGVVFTLLGPLILWLAYRDGPFLALAIAEIDCHLVIYLSLRHLVYPRSHGFHVSVQRYILAAIPTALINIVMVAISGIC